MEKLYIKQKRENHGQKALKLEDQKSKCLQSKRMGARCVFKKNHIEPSKRRQCSTFSQKNIDHKGLI